MVHRLDVAHACKFTMQATPCTERYIVVGELCSDLAGLLPDFYKRKDLWRDIRLDKNYEVITSSILILRI